MTDCVAVVMVKDAFAEKLDHLPQGLWVDGEFENLWSAVRTLHLVEAIGHI